VDEFEHWRKEAVESVTSSFLHKSKCAPGLPECWWARSHLSFLFCDHEKTM